MHPFLVISLTLLTGIAYHCKFPVLEIVGHVVSSLVYSVQLLVELFSESGPVFFAVIEWVTAAARQIFLYPWFYLKAVVGGIVALVGYPGYAWAEMYHAQYLLGQAEAEVERLRQQVKDEKAAHSQTKWNLGVERNRLQHTKGLLELEERNHRDTRAKLEGLVSDHLWVSQVNENLRADAYNVTGLEYRLELSDKSRKRAETILAHTNEQFKAKVAKLQRTHDKEMATLKRTHDEDMATLQEGFEADSKDRDDEVKELKAAKIELGKTITETKKLLQESKLAMAYKDRDVRRLQCIKRNLETELKKVKTELKVFTDPIDEKRREQERLAHEKFLAENPDWAKLKAEEEEL